MIANKTTSFNNALSLYKEQSAMDIIHHDLVLRFVELQCLLIAPIAPHWAESIWLEVLDKPHSIQLARFPVIPEVDAGLNVAHKYIVQTSSSVNSAESLQIKKKAKGKDVLFDPKKPKKLSIYINQTFSTWHSELIDLLQELWDPVTKSVMDKTLMSRIDKAERKRAVPFIQTLKKRLQSGEKESIVFSHQLSFDEKEVLISMTTTLMRSAGLAQIQIISVQKGGSEGVDVVTGFKVDDMPVTAENAVPGNPILFLANV